jgi:hypothetical protein
VCDISTSLDGFIREIRATTGRQLAAEVLNRARVSAIEPEPGLLHRVVRLVQRAEHAIGDPAQTRPMLLEPLRQPLGSYG